VLELLKQADLILSPCGRPTAPPGYRWVDLPRIIPHQVIVPTAVNQNVTRVQNIANTVFLCRGIAINTVSAAYRIRWPNGRVLESAIARNPIGTAQIMKALEPEVPVEPQGQIQIMLNSTIGANADSDTVTLLFYGVLRYLLKATGAEPPQVVLSLAQAPRIKGSPNQNIMCPEWYLGEQCTPETPPGCYDEPFTLFSDPIAVAVGDQVASYPVQVPGDCNCFVVKRWSFQTVLDDEVTGGFPVVGWRLADGYSITGADLVPAQATGVVFVSLPVPGGSRMFLDIANVAGTGAGNFTTTVRFDGVKRRTLAQ
jgi:hypothetical protein